MTGIDYEKEYDNRGRVPDHPVIFARWDKDAAAYRDERSLVVVNSGQFQDDPEIEPRQAEIKFDDGWTYRLTAPLNISARGVCDPVEADLFYNGFPRMRMHGLTDCSFTWERIRS